MTTMVSLALILIMVTLAIVSYKSHLNARKSLAVGGASRDVSDAMTSAMLNSFVAYVHTKCANAAGLTVIPLGRIGALNLTKSITLGGVSMVSAPTDFKDGATRCQNVATHLAGAAGDRVYGCFQFAPNPGTQAQTNGDAFLQSKAAFLEITGVLQDFASALPLTCAAANTAAGAPGIAAYYAIHWVNTSADGPLYKSKYGVLYSGI